MMGSFTKIFVFSARSREVGPDLKAQECTSAEDAARQSIKRHLVFVLYSPTGRRAHPTQALKGEEPKRSLLAMKRSRPAGLHRSLSTHQCLPCGRQAVRSETCHCRRGARGRLARGEQSCAPKDPPRFRLG